MAAIYAVLNFGLPYCVLRSNLRKSERAINTKSCAQWVFVNNEMGQTAENILTSLCLSLSLSLSLHILAENVCQNFKRKYLSKNHEMF